MRGAWVPSLVRELRSHMPRGAEQQMLLENLNTSMQKNPPKLATKTDHTLHHMQRLTQNGS